MRYRIVLVQNLKNNYIRLPADSALRRAIAATEQPSGLISSLGRSQSHCQAIKVVPCIDDQRGRPFYFGFAGGTSAEANTIELSQELGLLIGLENDMLVSASVEYSY